MNKDFFKNTFVEQYEKYLAEELSKSDDVRPPHFVRLQIFSVTFGKICTHTPVFGNILRQVKSAYDLYTEYLLDVQLSAKCEMLVSGIRGMTIKAVKTEDVEVSLQTVRKLEHKAHAVLENNNQLRDCLRTKLTLCKKANRESILQSAFKESTEWSYFRSKGYLFDLKRRELLTMFNKVQNLEDKISNMTHAVNAESVAQYISDVQAKTLKLKSSSEFFQQTSKDLDNELHRILMKQTLTLETQKEIRQLIECFISIEK